MFTTCPFCNTIRRTRARIMLPFGIVSHYLIYDKLQSGAEERLYSLVHADPFPQLFPCHVGAVSQLVSAGCNGFSPSANGMSGFKQGKRWLWCEGNTCSQDKDLGTLPEALSTAGDKKKKFTCVLGNFDGKTAAGYKLSNRRSRVSLINVRRRH